MVQYISAKRKGIHITNRTRTALFLFLSEACNMVFDAVRNTLRFVRALEKVGQEKRQEK